MKYNQKQKFIHELTMITYTQLAKIIKTKSRCFSLHKNSKTIVLPAYAEYRINDNGPSYGTSRLKEHAPT